MSDSEKSLFGFTWKKKKKTAEAEHKGGGCCH